MDHNNPSYYDHRNTSSTIYDNDRIDEDEEYSEDLFLRQHYGPPSGANGGLGGLGLVRDDDDSDNDHPYNPHRHQGHQGGGGLRAIHGGHDDDDEDDVDFHDDEDEDDLDDLEEEEDEYNELDMDQHNIHLLSGSLSVRSPFLDAIREEEDEEPVFTKPPSSYPSFGSSRSFVQNRSSGEFGSSGWGPKPIGGVVATAAAAAAAGGLVSATTGSGASAGVVVDEELQDGQQANFNNTNQSDGKPRGPRPPLLLGRPRSNTSSLTRVTTGFEVPTRVDSLEGRNEVLSNNSSSAGSASNPSSSDATSKRDDCQSPESTIQDLEVKRVLEGTAAASTPSSSSSKDLLSLSTPGATSNTPADLTASFSQDTQKSIDDFFGMVKSDLDKRIQEAIQEVEQKFLDRVQKLEKHTATLSGAPEDIAAAEAAAGGSGEHKSGSLMESLTRPLPAHQNPGGSLALRKEILSHVTEKVGDLDLRVNQMEVLVSYKLVDIESKVQDLHGAHNSIAQKVHQVANSHQSKMKGIHAGAGVGEGTINDEELRVNGAVQPYMAIDQHGNRTGTGGRAGGAFLENMDGSDTGGETSTALVDTSTIGELRHELQTLGVRYQELNDGLLTDLMGQMRDAKLMLFQTVDEVDGRISKRVDRIEAEMHSKLLSEIEGRVQERVRAMEQTSSRLERCFDKMEGRLGALETVLASKRPRPESMYQLLQQQLQQQPQQDDGHGANSGYAQHAGTFAGFPTTNTGHGSVTSLLFSDLAAAAPAPAVTQFPKPRRRTLAEQAALSSPDSPTPGQQESESGLMYLDTDSVHSNSTKNNSNPKAAIMASPLDGFVSQAQAKPIIWSGRSAPTSTSTAAASSSFVASPLERGTVIGSRMGTIHPEYQPRTSYIPATTPIPTKEIASSAPSSSSSSGLSSGRGARRVSLTNFDANSLAALKPIKASTATATEGPVSTSIVTTTTTTTTMTTQHNSNSTKSNHNNPASIKMRMNQQNSQSSASLLTLPKSGGGAGSFVPGSATSTMQRAMTFDTLHSQAHSSSTMTKTVVKPAPVQGPSSYRELLSFWKSGTSSAV